jgi:hypothetical protein
MPIITMTKPREMGWAAQVVHMGQKGKPFRKPRRKWEDNIKMDIKAIRWKGEN